MVNYFLKRGPDGPSGPNTDAIICKFNGPKWDCRNEVYNGTGSRARMDFLVKNNIVNINDVDLDIDAAKVKTTSDRITIIPLRNAHMLDCKVEPGLLWCRDKTNKYYT